VKVEHDPEFQERIDAFGTQQACGHPPLPHAFFLLEPPLGDRPERTRRCRFGPTPPGMSETMHGAVHGLDNLYVVNASFPPARWAWSAQR